MEYKINITRLEYIPTYNTYEKVVNKVYWNYEATKGIISTGIGGSTELTPPESIFVPFDNLQEDIVVGWISGSLDINNLQSTLNNSIDNIENPKIVQSIPPWMSMPSGSSNI
jgi:hypothetical protein